ncbi:dihydrofolate reductase family protein [Acrocarpospora catenulata]|uniref:dihydrofolate reductase family protein n=1 Tax=Acrocarpospora catenulata TaxID=2836182 RepID=UPI001BDB5E9B|nr:dihydrofolate reductase family protein [Acrocarpospora catenulata]
MRKLVYLINATIDGYIAGPAGQSDFFLLEGDHQEELSAEFPETVPRPLRPQLGLNGAPNRRFDTVIMGRSSYQPAMAAGVTSPFPHLRQYVISRTLADADPELIVDGDPLDLVRRLKRDHGLDIWLSGGGRLAGALLSEIDELIVKQHPIVAGAGIPLFTGPFHPTRFTPAAERTFRSGVRLLRHVAHVHRRDEP